MMENCLLITLNHLLLKDQPRRGDYGKSLLWSFNTFDQTPCHIACVSHCMAECFHSQDVALQCTADASHCLLINMVSHAWYAAHATQRPPSTVIHVHSHVHRTATVPRTKFEHMPTRYYANSDATFNLPLSGDVKTNPGPPLVINCNQKLSQSD